jgi:hypothetical protein
MQETIPQTIATKRIVTINNFDLISVTQKLLYKVHDLCSINFMKYSEHLL